MATAGWSEPRVASLIATARSYCALAPARSLGTCEFTEEGREKLEHSLDLAQRAGLVEQVGRTYILLVGTAVEARRYGLATRYLQTGIDYCSERGVELDRLYLLAHRARLELDQGRWGQASDSAEAVLRIPRTSITPRILALVVLGLSGRGAETRASGRRSRRRGRWPSRPGSCRVWRRSRRREPRRHGKKATATPSLRQPRAPSGSPWSGSRGGWRAILAKLGVRSRRQAAQVAAERDIRHADGEPAPRR